jgi:Uma2 family endonuclease
MCKELPGRHQDDAGAEFGVEARYSGCMTPSVQVSVDEYLSTVYEPECEYVDGELIDRNVGESDHSGLQGIVFGMLLGQRRAAGVHIFPELRVQVAATRFRVPDITGTTSKIKGCILREPPFLCIEVLSPEDRASRLLAKIDDYFAFGVRYVWVIDPEEKMAWSYTSDGKRESATVLTTGSPRLTLNMPEVFAALADDIVPEVPHGPKTNIRMPAFAKFVAGPISGIRARSAYVRSTASRNCFATSRLACSERYR